jgi:hypothetical protein
MWSAGTLVMKSIPLREPTAARSLARTWRLAEKFFALRHLDAMADKIRALEQRLAALEKKS